MAMEKSQCACCFYYTLEGVVTDICPVCFWQKDFYQEEQIDDNDAPNTISLREARKNYKKYGVSDPQFKKNVRPPLEEELQKYP